ncbi:hypothetical protein DS884_06810 [Tenacibaculum sp. E3R01]|uniref:hypothetical protein n=1 Tax=Tenacibaculum sp. E3R01 TaxID=2267227 RepID=UPI000DE83050|nr:hypothetical protein [Tenacibaculum sp. E3R01]RBW59444.1 hypothetical protein DS884_06810 [Tenacibaculum sp. E3R01]
MKQNKETLKAYFETGDKPTQEQYSDLVDSYIDAKQPTGGANRRFVINKTGDVNVTSEQAIPEYSLSNIVNNKFSIIKDGNVIKELDLTQFANDSSSIGQLPKKSYDNTYSTKFHDVVLNTENNLLHTHTYTDWVDVPLNSGYSASYLKIKLEGKFMLISGFNLTGSSDDNIITSQLPYTIQTTQYFRGGGGGPTGMQDYKVQTNSTSLHSIGSLTGFNEFFAILMIQTN